MNKLLFINAHFEPEHSSKTDLHIYSFSLATSVYQCTVVVSIVVVYTVFTPVYMQ